MNSPLDWVGWGRRAFCTRAGICFSCRPYRRKFSWSQLLRQMLRGANGPQPAAQKEGELLICKSECDYMARAALASPAHHSRRAAWGTTCFLHQGRHMLFMPPVQTKIFLVSAFETDASRCKRTSTRGSKRGRALNYSPYPIMPRSPYQLEEGLSGRQPHLVWLEVQLCL